MNAYVKIYGVPMAAKLKKQVKKDDSISVACAFDKMVAVDQLKPNPRNPNVHPKSQIAALAKLIEHLGWRAPVTVSNLSGFVVRGHGRLAAARVLGVTAVPVDFQDYASAADEWTDLLADNRIPEFATMDDELTVALLKELKKLEADVGLTGYSERDFEKMIEDGKVADSGPEIEFSQELLLEHNYIVLYFDNPFDWTVALDKFKLKTVKDLIERKGQRDGNRARR